MTRIDHRSGNAELLFVGLVRIALEAIHELGLRRSKRQQIAPGLLECDKKLLAMLHDILVELILPLELGLEREGAAERVVSASFEKTESFARLWQALNVDETRSWLAEAFRDRASCFD